jgi:Fe-S-cluster-containing hydrogenase component 2
MANVICPHICKDCYALNVCAVHAIEEQDGSITLDPRKCVSCGTCRTACVTFGSGTIKHKMIKAERLRPLPPPPGSPWAKEEDYASR